MATKSAFIQYIDKWFKKIVLNVVNTLNGKNTETLTYRFKEMLRAEFSLSGKWETISTHSTRVSADFVAMNSSLPLKMRDSIGKVSGDITKSGMELWLNEKQLTELHSMRALNIPESEIVAKLFADTPRVVTGIYELMEKCLLEGLSTGVTVIDDTENVGTGVRMDYGYLDQNKFGAKALWTNQDTATPLDDFRRVIKKARSVGNTVAQVYMDDVTFDNFVKTKQVREYFAWTLKFVGDLSIAPTPTIEEINSALKKDNRFKLTIHIIDRTIINEKNGKRTVVTPWQEGNVIFTATTQVGVLAWARLAEMDSPVDGVSYEVADSFILVSKFRQNRPHLAEFTTSQARVVPVICDVERIYLLNTKTIQA
jgi:hypothetical protein